MENIFYKWTPRKMFSIYRPEYMAPSIVVPQLNSRTPRTVVPYIVQLEWGRTTYDPKGATLAGALSTL
jgi:hypothetical protein